MRISRADNSVIGRWWLSFDRVLMGAVLVLMVAGLVISLASSTSVAARKGLPALYFAERQMILAGVGALIMIAVSMLPERAIRRLALALFVGGLAAMVFVVGWGEEINGARRWLRIAGYSLQPSELAKPGFAVLAGWAFAESERRLDMPGMTVAALLLLAFATLLALQPDIGQTLLVATVWVVLFLLSGRSHRAAVAVGGAGATGLIAAYSFYPHVRLRIDRFLAPVKGENIQLDRSYQSFAEGGLLGRGPGEGTIKTVLPDAHTDFVLAVVAEELGALAALALVLLIAVIVLRPLLKATEMHDGFRRYATISLALLVGVQALINLGSNVGLLPTKGMTLPFVSVGGSSLIAMAITCGMLLSLTRRRADAREVKVPDLLNVETPPKSHWRPQSN